MYSAIAAIHLTIVPSVMYSAVLMLLRVGGIEYCITGMIIHSYTVIITNTASINAAVFSMMAALCCHH